ncbi:MAG: L,D-transpeptidase, partial [Rubrobacteridae bacterium]|nr:L,D-transpeptidase [Rubrobacteridae bacterium]
MKKRVVLIMLLVFCLFAGIVFWTAVPVKDESLSFSDQLKQKVAYKISLDAVDETISLSQACVEKNVSYPRKKTGIVVDKSDFKLYLYSGKTMLKAYPAALGRDPVRAKEKRDDMRTPEGMYYICERSTNPGQKYMGTRWMRLSYPNKEDAARGLRDGLVTEAEARRITEAIDYKKKPDQET